ncbi:MAG: MBL fold metallo-hydrolase [Bacteroidia bacterium]|nr:MBL fold metallo-hydrolase [Bacteroidia bacterium]
MKVKFWGCRGSIPASYSASQTRTKIKQVLQAALDADLKRSEDIDNFLDGLPFNLRGAYGSNTSCVEIIGGDEVIICDAGSGLRDLGKAMVMMGPNMPKVYHILISHMHWDHIQGFPFFIPAYMQGVIINIWGCHSNIRETFILQQQEPTFPVRLEDMGSQINFHTMDVNENYQIAGMDISIWEQPHPGISYGFRFDHDGQSVVYSTDAEHTDELHKEDYPFLDFIRNADVLVFDAQFNLADHVYIKQNWGHSSNLVGIELAVRAGVKKLFLFHSDHMFGDEDLEKFLNDSLRYLEIYDDKSQLELNIAYDGLLVDLD